MTTVSQTDLPVDLYLRDVFGRKELETTFTLWANAPDIRIGDWLNVGATPVVVGEVEDGAESDVGIVCRFFFDSVVDATGVD